MNVLRQLLALLTRRERIRIVALAGAMILMGLVETVGVASILPFMQVVADPGILQGDGWLASLYDGLGFESVRGALFAAGSALLLIIAFNNGFNALTLWFMHRFAWSLNHRLSTDLLARYLRRPYTFFLGHNTAGMNQTLLTEVNLVVTGVVLPLLQVAARSIAALLILGLLAVVDLELAAILALVFGGAYGLVYAFIRRRQYHLGWERYNQNARRFTIAQEALTGIKDVKTLGREDEFLRRFAEPSRRFSSAAAKHLVVARLPRYLLEAVGFGGILVILLVQLGVRADLAPLLPVLSLYAFAGYRLMPALNELFSSIVSIRFNTAALDQLHRDLAGAGEVPGAPAETTRAAAGARGTPAEAAPAAGDAAGAPVEAAPVTGDVSVTPADAVPAPCIELREVSFRFPDAPEPTLRNVSLQIRPRQVVGFVGPTGAGKTTIVDLVLGLLAPTEGVILVDGRELDPGSAARWRSRCGYVPQDVFLADDTVRANVAFGIPAAEVGREAVEQAARIAQLHEFVAALPDGYDTVVGERGIRLSGGQRQRIGIARALYHDPEVLVLDEATNALDGVTETAVIETIHSLVRKKTLLVIAHRLSTVRACDAIHMLEDGRIVATGTYDELFRDSPRFRAMAGAAAGSGPAS